MIRDALSNLMFPGTSTTNTAVLKATLLGLGQPRHRTCRDLQDLGGTFMPLINCARASQLHALILGPSWHHTALISLPLPAFTPPQKAFAVLVSTANSRLSASHCAWYLNPAVRDTGSLTGPTLQDLH